MPLLSLNLVDGHPELEGGGCAYQALTDQLKSLPKDAPVVICIHGYKFSPQHKSFSPHRHILALDPTKSCWKAMSWPRHLGFGRGLHNEGLCIALGWTARGSIWQAFTAARDAGDIVAKLIAFIDRPVHLVGHSLGARVALRAMAVSKEKSVRRAILLAAADFRSSAMQALASPAGQTADVVNITSRENDLFDALLETLVRAPEKHDVALGMGLNGAAHNWVDIQIDHDDCLNNLRHLGFRIAAPSRRICHWSAYVRPGAFAFYTALIRAPDSLPFEMLQTQIPQVSSPRWSRLFKWPETHISLPFARKATF
ncbi:Alpha/beta hydrolase family protein [Pacificibacter marinus]|uniref:Alpha/beta hydrolase family protein n=2 Tax=Pacificibacter marinus TaxID=658057 RepID=A0A1Y5SQ92_9RHOB|nr:Alpha/beta hydrolase family protein [Pacificibacter marinus]SLN45786.1 Alpha/beta hydrolase family protein [Pacificibacter marinus]